MKATVRPNANGSAARWAALQAARNQSIAEIDDPISDDHRAFREQHNQIERVKKHDVGVTDEIGYTFRAVDTLALMHRSGSIDDDMLAAGRRFRDDFSRAHLEALKAADYTRACVDCRPTADVNLRSYAARNRVWDAIRAVGGLGGLKTRPGSVVWHIVGQGDSLTEWAAHQAGGLHKFTASGLLIGALEALAWHYGLKK